MVPHQNFINFRGFSNLSYGDPIIKTVMTTVSVANNHFSKKHRKSNDCYAENLKMIALKPFLKLQNKDAKCTSED